MSDTNLPWTFLGRKIRPFALGISLACLVIALSLLIGHEDAGRILDGMSFYGMVVGVTALTAVCLLWAGWWDSSDRLMRAGLFLSVGVFSARAALLFLDLGVGKVSGWLSLSIVVMAGGAWLLERTDHRTNAPLGRDRE